jgi:hypothetical protein
VRTTYVNPANVDFGSLVLDVGAAWRPVPAVRVGLSGQRYQTFARKVRDSPYSMTDPPADLDTFPSGNGDYRLSLWRFGLTMQLMIPTRGS